MFVAIADPWPSRTDMSNRTWRSLLLAAGLTFAAILFAFSGRSDRTAMPDRPPALAALRDGRTAAPADAVGKLERALDEMRRPPSSGDPAGRRRKALQAYMDVSPHLGADDRRQLYAHIIALEGTHKEGR
jgi:hypothetical protein